MKKFKSQELIEQLEQDIKQIILAAEHLRQADAVKLSYPPAEGQWSVIQVLEHVNAYNRYYLPEIEKSIVTISNDRDSWFVPGFFGDYFTKMMMPKNVFDIKNKMKSVKKYSPPRGLHVETVFQEFIEHQNKLIQLLEVS